MFALLYTNLNMGLVLIFTEGNYYLYKVQYETARHLDTILNCGALSNIAIAPVWELPEGARAREILLQNHEQICNLFKSSLKHMYGIPFEKYLQGLLKRTPVEIVV